MPAVDAPDDGGIAYAELELLIANLVSTPDCLGMELTVFDPDYDPDGGYARELVAALVTGLGPLLQPQPQTVPLAMPTQRTESSLEITRVPAPGRRRSSRPARGAAEGP
jgi:arginase